MAGRDIPCLASRGVYRPADGPTFAGMNPARGISLKILSVVIFMAMSICVKVVAERLPAGEIVFFRSLFAIPVILIWLGHAHHLHDGLKTKNPLGHLWRGLLGVSAMGFSFTALGLLPLPEATAISYAKPVLVTVFAAMFLGEVVRAYRVSAVILGLVGVLIVLAPRLGAGTFGSVGSAAAVGAMAALMAAICGAMAEIFLRRLTRTEATACIVFYFSITAMVLSLLTVPFGWIWPTPTEIALLGAIGLFGGLGQIAKTHAYRFADVSLIAPFQYTSMILAVAAGYFLFAEVPTLTMLAGAALVVLAGLIIIWRERQLGLGRERRRAREATMPHG